MTPTSVRLTQDLNSEHAPTDLSMRVRQIAKISFYSGCKVVCRTLFILYGQGRISGVANVPSRGPVVLACNHQSFADPILAGLPLKRSCHFMARDSLFRNRAFGPLIKSLNAFPVKRASADLGAIKNALALLKGGAALVTFPEGTRSKDGSIRQTQPGIITIAKRAKCPIVPTIIEGAYEAWPRHRLAPQPSRMWVGYLPPLTSDCLETLTLEQAAALVTEKLRQGQNELRRRLGRTTFEYDSKSK